MSASIRTYAESSHPLIVVGDRKTPRDWPQFEMSKNRYIPIEQHGCFEVGRMMPENHYARKNVGYVSAMIDNPDVIFDTDDDNAPNGHWREPPAWECERCISIDAPYNAYKNFTAQSIWPRGFPLDLASYPLILEPIERHMRVGIWQMLANRSPDVDAVWRLMGDIPIEFALGEAFALDMGPWCPWISFGRRGAFVPSLPTPRRPSARIHDKGYPWKPPLALLQSPPRTFMVSWGVLAKTVKASQSIESVKPESMDSIELLYGTLWVAPPCYQDGGHSAPPRSLSAFGADRFCLPTMDDGVPV